MNEKEKDQDYVSLPLYSFEGKDTGQTLELSASVFALKDFSEGSVYHSLINELANRRVGTASVKNRSAVSGSSAKPWRQKGTGRARAGHKRSPLWRGGGVVFGPQPRDYSYKLPQKIKRLAVRSLLSYKCAHQNLRILDDFSIVSGKTREMVPLLRNFQMTGRSLFILQDEDIFFKRALRNVPNFSSLAFNRLAVHTLMYADTVLLTKQAALGLSEFYSSNKKRGLA